MTWHSNFIKMALHIPLSYYRKVKLLVCQVFTYIYIRLDILKIKRNKRKKTKPVWYNTTEIDTPILCLKNEGF